MEISWLNLFGHGLIRLVLLGLLSEIWYESKRGRRRTEALEGVGRALTALAEGLSLQGAARLCRVEVETVALWLELAASHFADLAEYLSQHLEIDQVQLDDLYVRLGAVRSRQKGRGRWLYNAFHPVSKFGWDRAWESARYPPSSI